MKLFQQLLVAPAALGLMAPLAANAAELNLNGVSGYSDSAEEVQSISQFSDVYPTDWAYQALTNLAERNGCVAATPNGSMTRYEAAALLNNCLGSVAQVNEEERRLINEFAPELAVIKGRVDGLEARVGEFEAGQFSTTTKMSGKTHFVTGFVDDESESQTRSAGTFQYSSTWNLNTSFNGKDLLYTRVKTGNFVDNGPFENKDYGTYLSAAKDNGNALKVDKIWYEFPLGDEFKVWVGPEIENYYMLAVAPSIYKPILKGFALGGNGATYGASTAQGFGVAWSQEVSDPTDNRFTVSTNYVAKNGDSADAGNGGGMFTDNQSNWLTQISYGAPRWQVSMAVARKSCDEPASGGDTESCFDGGSYFSTTDGKNRTGNSTNYGFRAYWKPIEVNAIPSVQVGYDWATVDDDNVAGSTENTRSWMIGLMWKDLFVDGNKAGVALGQRQMATDKVSNLDDGGDSNRIWEAYYTFQVSDNITVTPALFGGLDTKAGSSDRDDDFWGGLVQTTFKF